MAVRRMHQPLSTPLHEIRFAVVDVETTGSGPDDRLTEVGVVVVRGGAVERTFSSLVHPGRPIPGRISLLTGITDAIVCDAPRPEEVLASIVELLDGSVLVGHNVAFDRSMLTRAFEHCGLGNPIGVSLDTLALARRLVRDEVPDCTLGTLAAHLRLDHRPTHRALTDALATVDLLHHLIERSAGYGVVGLDDLIGLTRLAGHPWAGKLALTASLPRSPGVYTFLGRAGQPIYVGTATDVRSRVRSYFGSDDRRSIRPLLRDTVRVDAHPAPHPLVAHVWEQRLLAAHLPEHNRAAPRPADDRYLRLTDEPFPRLAIARQPTAPGVIAGPMRGHARAQRVIEAFHDALPLRRCTLRPRSDRAIVDTPCAAAQLGRAACPCAGPTPDVTSAHARTVDQLRRSLAGEPELVLAPLMERMWRRAGDRRYEEAAWIRDRGDAFDDLVDRAGLISALSTDTRVLAVGNARVVIEGGLLLDARSLEGGEAAVAPPPGAGPEAVTSASHETVLIGRWLRRNRARWRVVEGEPLDLPAHVPWTVAPWAATPSTLAWPSGGSAAAIAAA